MSRECRDSDYLEHIQDAIAKINRYTNGKDDAEFLGNELIQDAVIRNLEIIGEAVTKLSPELSATLGNGGTVVDNATPSNSKRGFQ